MKSSFSRGKRILILILLGMAGLLSPLSLSSTRARIPLAKAQDQPASQAAGFSFSGRLVPRHWVNLSFPEAGRVTRIFTGEGDSVQPGAQLARLGNPQPLEANIAAAEQELLLAQQAYDDLVQHAGEALAQAEVRLAEARKVQKDASWKVRRMKKPVPEQQIEQAHANMLLVEKSLKQTRKDLDKAEKLWNDRKSFIWWFVPRGKFKLQIHFLDRKLAQAELRYQDAVEKYDDLRKPVDEIDLQVAEADLALADEQLDKALRDRDSLLNGPDPDEAALAQARIQAASQALTAAKSAAADALLTAPFSGEVVSIPMKEGEWVRSGQRVMTLADRSAWNVEIEDLPETDVSKLEVGQDVQVAFNALPDLEYQGQVESISLVNGEEDGDITYKVVVSLPGNDPQLRWGMTANISFQE